MPDPAPSNLTDCGLPGIRNIPYGVHMCHFYRGGDELAAVLLDAVSAKRAHAQGGVDVDGYAGIRITGNVSFLTPETWPAFMEYEDMVHRHSCTLEHPDEGWQILTGISA